MKTAYNGLWLRFCEDAQTTSWKTCKAVWEKSQQVVPFTYNLLPVCMKLRFSSIIAVCITLKSWASSLTASHNLLLLFEQSAWPILRQKCIYFWFLCKMFWMLLWNPVMYKTLRYWMIWVKFIRYFQWVTQKWAFIFFTILNLCVSRRRNCNRLAWNDMQLSLNVQTDIYCVTSYSFSPKVACSPQCNASFTFM